MTKEPILSFRGEYRWLSNFHEADVIHLNRVFPTNEHAYAASKTADPRLIDMILQCETPGQAMRLGRTFDLVSNWHESYKFVVMHEINLQKFTRHEDLKQKLLDTWPAHLEEGNTHGDRIWGTVDGIGQNALGKILMAVRNHLRFF